ncbi:hypothetical protein [Fictibacillus sp. NRS-1165]|uniref:hypothetical protein n=1 Tax=Fictibacillus sp. NRS-1165 TaxID=3144463 RepID=UPI003D1E8D53
MFSLFFILLMPLVLFTSYGAILAGIFSIDTAIPFLGFIGLIGYFGLCGAIMKKGRRYGRIVQQIFGTLIILLV